MTAPTVKILLGFPTTPTLGNNFVLDDPVKGVLANSTYLLGGSVFVDVSQWVSGNIQVQRGRSRETDQYQAGSLSFTLRNEDRRFDPSNTASPYAPGIQPRALVMAFIAGQQVFGGYVDDYTVNYEIPNICTVDVACLDGFSIPANTYLYNYTGASQLTGARINNILDTIGYPASRNIAAGLTMLAAGGLSNRVHAIDDLQMAARSENGYLYVDKAGVMTFHDRYYLAGAVSSMTFSDTGSGIPYQGITQKSQTLLLYNQVTGQRRLGGTRQQAQDAASVAEFLPRELLLGQLDNATDADVLSLCEYLVGRYSQPDLRFNTVTVELRSVDLATQQQLCGLDLIKLVTVNRTPAGSGTPTTISKLSVVDGISFSLDASSSTSTITLTLASFDTRNFLILDDPVFGILGSAKVGY